jgi:hypothetical protein
MAYPRFRLISIWLFLMVRSALAEYQYYKSVRTLEPTTWQQLGSPRFLKVPFVFVSSKGAALLKDISNESVCYSAPLI